MVLILYLIHRTITDGENDIDKGIIHIEPLFHSLASVAEKIDSNIIGPIGGEFLKTGMKLNAMKNELKNSGLLNDVETTIKQTGLK